VPRTALILAGGSGTRFWPASRRLRPKQLLALDGERSLIARTLARLEPLISPDDVWVSTTGELAPAVAAELPELAADRILAEPAGRNTAPAIAWSLQALPAERRAAAVAVLPADHRIGDPPAFRAALESAFQAVEREDRVVALGVAPRYAETGFGYLELGEELAGGRGLRRVIEFREKPDRDTAIGYLASGRHLWNAGMFLFRGTTLLAHLERLAPELASGLAEIARDPERVGELYPRLPSISIDHAVMEKLDALVALPLECGWDDLGSWSALYDALAADEAGNRARGDVVAIDSRDNVLVAESGTVAVVGVEGLVIVRTADAVLVVPRERAQEVRRIVDRLAAAGRGELL
jgi:mannose-1-phosphate guanylyltransferase